MHANPAQQTGIVGLALLYWGWQSGNWALAIPLALLLEAPRITSRRWRFSDTEINRVVDIGNLIFLLTAGYFFIRYRAHGIYQITLWMPALLALLLAVQRYSDSGQLRLGNLFLSLRRPDAENQQLAARPVTLDYSYAAICLVAATVSAAQAVWHVPVLLAFVALALAPLRSRRYAWHVWLLTILLVGVLGFIGQAGLRIGQSHVEEWVVSLFRDHLWNHQDPYRAHTAIGQIGRLKFSDEVLFRVRADTPPPLLRQSSYQTYRYGSWAIDADRFAPVATGGRIGYWQLGDAPAGHTHELVISGPAARGKSVPPLPAGTVAFGKILADKASINPLGTVLLADTPGFLEYHARYVDSGSYRDQPPQPADLALAADNRELIARIAATIGLPTAASDQAAVAKLKTFFADFRYSLVQRATLSNLPPLARFLRNDKQGHCEYFATSTTLLLRAAGIPARYATGYAATEYSPLEDAYLVRRRHAHAWTIAWLDGRWQDIDFTPSVWADLEQQQATWWVPLRDMTSWLRFQFSAWRWREDDAEQDGLNLLWLLPVLLIYLAWRLRKQQRAPRRVQGGKQRDLTRVGTPFDAVVAHLERTAGRRATGETLRDWLRRLQLLPTDRQLAEMLRSHYALRFNPMPPPGLREALASAVAAYLGNSSRS